MVYSFNIKMHNFIEQPTILGLFREVVQAGGTGKAFSLLILKGLH
jgi:hypothetical protein